jgi:excisionase family DNA binding protein
MSRQTTPITAEPNRTTAPSRQVRASSGKTLDFRLDQLESVTLGDLLAFAADVLAPMVAARVGAAPAPVSPYLSVAEAADYMRCKPQRVYDLLSARRLSRVKDGARTLLLRDEIDSYLAGDVLPARCPPSRNGASRLGSRAA